MKLVSYAVVLLWSMQVALVSAQSLELNAVAGLPGETVTLRLSIDEVPLDASGLFTLDALITWDESQLAYLDARQVGVFTDAIAQFAIAEINGSGDSRTIGFTAQYQAQDGMPEPPGGGELLELDFQILEDSSASQAIVDLQVTSSVNGGVVAGSDGLVSVSLDTVQVPIPGVFLLLGAIGTCFFGYRARLRGP